MILGRCSSIAGLQWRHAFAHWGSWYECRAVRGPCVWLALVGVAWQFEMLGPDTHLVDDL